MRPGLAPVVALEIGEGAGNAGCRPHPRALRAKKVHLRTQATTGQPDQPAFPARWFTAYTWSPRSTGLVSLRPPGLSACRPQGRHRLTRGLAPASGRRDRTISLVREECFRRRGKRAEHPHVHRIPLPTSVTIAIRPSQRRRDASRQSWISEKRKRYIFAGGA